MNYKLLKIGFPESIQIQTGKKGRPLAYNRMPGLLVNVESSRVGKKQNQHSITTGVKNESGELSTYSKLGRGGAF